MLVSDATTEPTPDCTTNRPNLADRRLSYDQKRLALNSSQFPAIKYEKDIYGKIAQNRMK